MLQLVAILLHSEGQFFIIEAIGCMSCPKTFSALNGGLLSFPSLRSLILNRNSAALVAPVSHEARRDVSFLVQRRSAIVGLSAQLSFL